MITIIVLVLLALVHVGFVMPKIIFWSEFDMALIEGVVFGTLFGYNLAQIRKQMQEMEHQKTLLQYTADIEAYYEKYGEDLPSCLTLVQESARKVEARRELKREQDEIERIRAERKEWVELSQAKLDETFTNIDAANKFVSTKTTAKMISRKNRKEYPPTKDSMMKSLHVADCTTRDHIYPQECLEEIITTDFRDSLESAQAVIEDMIQAGIFERIAPLMLKRIQ